MWPRRHLQTEVAKSLRSETQRRYVILKYFCVALGGRLSILRVCTVLWTIRDILAWNQTFVLDRWPRRTFNMTFTTSFFIPMDGRRRE